MPLTICMVAFGVGKVNGSYVGGHINNLVTMSKQLATRGHEIHIVTTPPIHGSGDQDPPSIHESINIHIESIETETSTDVSQTGRRSILYGLRSARHLIPRVIRLNDRFDFDIVHSHSGFPGVGLIPTTVRPLIGVPAVHTLYCPVPAKVRSHFVAFPCLRSLDCVLGVSVNVTNSVESNHLNADVRTVPPIVDTNRFRPRDKYNRDETFKVLFVGNFSESKGIDLLLEAIAKMSEQGHTVELLFAFDMPVERYQRESLPVKDRIQELGLENVVTPLGIVQDLPRTMHEADVFVAPFRDTQGPADYPLAMLEAMSTGLPVVGTNVGGIPEVIDDGVNGLLCPPDDVSALTDRLKHIAVEPTMAKSLGGNAVETIERMNSEIIDEIMDVYHEIQ